MIKKMMKRKKERKKERNKKNTDFEIYALLSFCCDLTTQNETKSILYIRHGVPIVNSVGDCGVQNGRRLRYVAVKRCWYLLVWLPRSATYSAEPNREEERKKRGKKNKRRLNGAKTKRKPKHERLIVSEFCLILLGSSYLFQRR